jgi:hypothetical protein
MSEQQTFVQSTAEVAEVRGGSNNSDIALRTSAASAVEWSVPMLPGSI